MWYLERVTAQKIVTAMVITIIEGLGPYLRPGLPRKQTQLLRTS